MNIKASIMAIVIIVIIVGGVYVVVNGNALKHVQTVNQSTAQTTQQAAYTTTQNYSTPSTTAPHVGNSTNRSTITPSYAVNVGNSSTLGTYLASSSGYALYIFGADVPYGNRSACYTSCATYWPAFYASNLTVSPALNLSDFGTINRTDGTKQLTYKGWPLYLYAGDRAPGEVNGQNLSSFGGTWYVATPNLTYK
jgi:predicted lipoprotein with Yx(FWY)xxD motif